MPSNSPTYRKVTDPDTLAQLNSDSVGQEYRKVTDPDVIRQLNGDESSRSKFPFELKLPTPEQTENVQRQANDVAKGASQSFINTPEQIANVFGKHLYNQFNYAPKTEAANTGRFVGDVGSYFLPGGTFKAGVNVLKYIPKAAAAINAIEKGIKSKPIVNFLLQGAKNAGEAALFEKAKNPKASKIDVAEAGGLGAGIPAAAHLMFGSNPLIRTLAGAAVGGATGYNYGGWPGALEGAGLGMAAPNALAEIGIGKAPIAHEMLTREPNPMARARYEAGERIGDVGTPAETFADRGKMARAQGRISHTEEGAEEMAAQGEQRIANQENAIKRLLNTIYPKAKGYTAETTALYKEAGKHNLSENAFNDLMENHVISDAAKEAADSSLYKQDLKDVGKNSVAYLDVIKKTLSDKVKSAKGNAARIYKQAEQQVIDAIEKESPVYKEARASAQRKIVRGEIQKALKGKPITGQHFFNKILANNDNFEELLTKLNNVPEAQQQLRDMKLAWENIVGMDTTRSVVGRTAGSTNQAREHFTKLWNEFKNMFGAPRDVQRAQFIHDPKWWNKFDEVMKYRDKVKRRDALVDLVSRGVTATGLEYPLSNKADLMVEAPISKK